MPNQIIIAPTGHITSISSDGDTACYAPGVWRDGVWTPTDIDTLPAAVKSIAAETWTPPVLDNLRDLIAEGEIPGPPASELINAERERRIAAGATVTVTGAGAIPVQGRDVDVRNLQGLGLGALARVSAGDTTTMTTFRDADNVDHELTPPQVLELVQKASAVAEAIITASWAIKAMDPLPADVTDDALWPST